MSNEWQSAEDMPPEIIMTWVIEGQSLEIKRYNLGGEVKYMASGDSDFFRGVCIMPTLDGLYSELLECSELLSKHAASTHRDVLGGGE